MNRTAATIAFLLAGAAFGQDIHFKTRTFRTTPAASGALAGHRIVEFDHYPSADDLNSLRQSGLNVIAALPDNAVVVSGAASADAVANGVKWTGTFDPADKLSPALGTGDAIAAVVEFHSDVAMDAQDAVAAAEGLTFARPAVLAANHAIVSASLDGLTSLAAHDEVAYIFPADPALLTDTGFIACVGMLTQSGAVPQYANIVHGWDLDSDNALHLSYFFGSVTPKVPAATVKSEIIRALNDWAKNANVIFQAGTTASAPRTVAVKFVSGSHGDAYPFQGYGPILAHTFYPVPVNPESIAGDMHLNADENWHAGSDIDIYSVALHEAGHALGLGHSDKPGDVMYPYYHPNMALSANDIGAAQSLYGAATAGAVTAAPVTGPVSPTSPLRITPDPSPVSTNAPATVVTGIVSGGTPPYAVQWQSDRGFSGHATLVSAAAWNAAAISLLNGANNITFTAFDAAGQSASQTVSVAQTTAPSSSAGSGPVAVSIVSPASAVTSVNSSTISISGKASGGSGIARVTWQTSTGATGIASGAAQWSAAGIPVYTGTTTVVVRAYDAAGASAWAAVVVVRH